MQGKCAVLVDSQLLYVYVTWPALWVKSSKSALRFGLGLHHRPESQIRNQILKLNRGGPADPTHWSVSWKKKVRYVIPLLVCHPACSIWSVTLIYLYLVIYPNWEALSPHLKTCLPLGCSQHRFKGQVVNDKREQRKQDSQRMCLKYHIYLSPQVNILSSTAGISTQFTRWGMGEWLGEFEPYHWEHL